MAKAKAKMQERAVMVPAMDIGVLRLKLIGTTPLLTNKFSDAALKKIIDKQGSVAKNKKHDVRNPEQEFKDSQYRVGRKHVFPSNAFIQAAVRAGKGVGINMTDSRSAFRAMGEYVEIKSDPPFMATHTIRLPNKAGGVAYRAQYDDWTAELMLTFDRAFLSEAEVVNLMNRAGWGVGVGAWRPEKSGTFGTFKVEMSPVGTKRKKSQGVEEEL